MKDKMSKMMDKKPKDESESSHHEAKMSVLNDLRDMAMNMMGDKANKYSPDPADISKVEVYGRSPKDLSQGIELAKQILPGEQGRPGSGLGQGKGMKLSSDSSLGSDGDMNEDFEASNPVDTNDDVDDMSEEEIDSMIAELQNKKRSKMMS